MPVLAAFLTTLGLLQLAAVYFNLRGASLTGALTAPGILTGITLLVTGIWLAIGQSLGLVLVLSLVVSFPAVLVLLVAGCVVNLNWHPMRHLLHDNTSPAGSVREVQIPARLGHDTDQSEQHTFTIPATYLTPRCTGKQGQTAPYPGVLLVCGAGDTRMSFKWALLRALLNEGMAVLTIDPPGHGEFRAVTMTVQNGSLACAAALEWLCKQESIGAAGACGISFGGNQVAALAAQDTRVGAIALISTPVELQPLSKRLYRLEKILLFLLPRNWLLLQHGSLITLWREWRRLKHAKYGHSLHDMVWQYAVLSAVRNIGARPVLVVNGTHDQAVPLTSAYEIRRAAVRGDLLTVAQGTHVSPILFNDTAVRIAQWFSTHLSTPNPQTDAHV